MVEVWALSTCLVLNFYVFFDLVLIQVAVIWASYLLHSLFQVNRIRLVLILAQCLIIWWRSRSTVFCSSSFILTQFYLKSFPEENTAWSLQRKVTSIASKYVNVIIEEAKSITTWKDTQFGQCFHCLQSISSDGCCQLLCSWITYHDPVKCALLWKDIDQQSEIL